MWRRKVLWSEGLFLRPQHFQQQERYLENLVERRARAIRSYGWGFETLEIDDGATAIGTIALRQASGILPDGTPFNLPADDLPPAPLTIRPDHPKDSLVYLAVVADRAGAPTATLDESDRLGALRFGSAAVDVVDSNQGFPDPAPMQLGELRLQLLSAADLSGAYCALALARVVERRADGQVILDRQFVGPSLSVNDCGLLRGYLGELRGLLSQRIDALAGRMAQPGRGGVAEIADFLLLQTVNRASALFEHLGAVPRLHPEQFYSHCVQLAGDLAAFGPDRRMSRPFPAYDHDDHGATFKPVMAQLRLALSMVLEQSAIPIELHDRKYGVRVAVIPDKSLLSTAGFVLAVSAQVPSETLRQRFPSQLKVGPVEKIRDLVNLQLPGIGLRALPVAPRQIPYHAGFNYFELDTRHELWDLLKNSGGLAMHLAGEFPGLELEFWAVRG
jgi:type VI secretion system protein ImpJ